MGSRHGCPPIPFFYMSFTKSVNVLHAYPREDKHSFKIVFWMSDNSFVHWKYQSKEKRDNDYTVINNTFKQQRELRKKGLIRVR